MCKVSTEGCQDVILAALNLLLDYDESCRSLAPKCFVSRNTLNGIRKGKIPKKNRQEIFVAFVKQLKIKYDEYFAASDFERAGFLKQRIYELLLQNLGI